MILVKGKHRFKHGDIMNGIGDLMIDERADIFYSDPPWGKGKLKYWYTINKKETGEEVKVANFSSFLSQVFCIIRQFSKNVILMEYGVRWKDEIIKRGREYGLIHNGVADLQYKSGSRLLPLHLHIFSQEGEIELPPNYLENLKGSTGLNTVRKAIYPFAKENKVILDPCCGRGYTAQVAKETGMEFRGNEFNKKRLDIAINRV